jgi:hypothetical protein
MSDEFIALIVTIAIIALLFVWVPLLNFVCPPCGRFLERWRQKGPPKAEPAKARASSVTAIRH